MNPHSQNSDDEGRASQANTSPVPVRTEAEINRLLASADAAFGENRFLEAKAALEAALQIMPDSAEILNALGSLLYRLGDSAKARAVFNGLVQKTPSDASAWIQLALVHHKLGSAPEFRDSLRRALELQPKNRVALKLLADHMVENEQLDQASKVYLDLLNSRPEDLEVLFALGSCFYRADDTACARMMYERVLQIQPANELAKENLEIIRRGVRPKAEALRKPPPLISVIISPCPSDGSIRTCLANLGEQTIGERLEIIVLNDGTQREALSVAEEFQQHFGNFGCIHKADSEPLIETRNRAIRSAKGMLITFAAAETEYRPDAFEKLAFVLSHQPGVSVVYADSELRSLDATQPGTAIGRLQWPDFSRDQLLEGDCVGAQAMWRKAVHDEFGYFDASFSAAAEYEFWLRTSKRSAFLHLPEILSLCRNSPGDREALNSAEFQAVRYRHSLPSVPRTPLQPPSRFLEIYPAPIVSHLQGWRNRPAVSVVMPTRNRPAMLREAIESVLRQTFQDFELLVVNDGGEDVTALVKELNQSGRIRCLRHPVHRGPSAARNMAITQARGKYIAYLDDDDLYFPNHLQVLVDYLETHSCKLAYTDGCRAQQLVQEKSYVITRKDTPYSQNFDRDLMLVGNFIPILCMVHERACLAGTGGFDETLPAVEDWDLWIRLTQHFRPAHLAQLTCEFRTRMESGQKLVKGLENLLVGTDSIYRKYGHLVRDKPLIRAWQLKNREDAIRKLREASAKP